MEYQPRSFCYEHGWGWPLRCQMGCYGLKEWLSWLSCLKNNWTRCLPKFWGHPLLIPFRQSIVEQSEYYHLRADVPQMSFHTLGGRVHNLALEDCLKKGPIRLKIVPKWQVDTGSCSTQLGAEEVSCAKLWLYWIIFLFTNGQHVFAILSYIHKPFIKWARRPAKTDRHTDTKTQLFYPGIGTSRTMLLSKPMAIYNCVVNNQQAIFSVILRT